MQDAQFSLAWSGPANRCISPLCMPELAASRCVLCISGVRTDDSEDATITFQPATSFNFDDDRSQEASREADNVVSNALLA